MKVLLPKPPSVNHIYGLTSQGKFARSYITKEGIAWFENAAGVLQKKIKDKSITAPVEIWIDLYHMRKQDVDNILKPLLDVLSKWCLVCQTRIYQRKGCRCKKNLTVLVDDDQVYRLNIEKHQINKEELEYVELEIMGY